MKIKARAIQAFRSDRARELKNQQRSKLHAEVAQHNLVNVFRNSLIAFEPAIWNETNLNHLRLYMQQQIQELCDNEVFSACHILRVWFTNHFGNGQVHAEFRAQIWNTVEWVMVGVTAPAYDLPTAEVYRPGRA